MIIDLYDFHTITYMFTWRCTWNHLVNKISWAASGVAAVALNFRDVLNVMGLYPGDPGWNQIRRLSRFKQLINKCDGSGTIFSGEWIVCSSKLELWFRTSCYSCFKKMFQLKKLMCFSLPASLADPCWMCGWPLTGGVGFSSDLLWLCSKVFTCLFCFPGKTCGIFKRFLAGRYESFGRWWVFFLRGANVCLLIWSWYALLDSTSELSSELWPASREPITAQ